MNPGLGRPSDPWIARGVSIGLHLLLLLLFGRALLTPRPPDTVVFSVETVSGLVPLGEGSGAKGTSSQISNTPANPNPLAGGLRLSVTDAPVPQRHEAKAKPQKARHSAQAPTLSDLDKQYEAMKIGVQPRDPNAADELSEGGMGNAHQAGTEKGALGLEGAIAGRGYRTGDYSYGKPLPEESEVQVLLTVGPKGEVLEAQIKKTSGYPELDQHALAKAREIVFDALPPDAPQVTETGTAIYSFDYNGNAK